MCLGCQRVSRLVFTKWQDYVQIRKDEALLNARASLYHSKQLLQSVIIMHTPFTMTLSLSPSVSWRQWRTALGASRLHNHTHLIAVTHYSQTLQLQVSMSCSHACPFSLTL